MAEKILSVDELTSEDEIEIEKVDLGNEKVAYIGSLTADQFVEWSEARASEDPGEVTGRRNSGALLIALSLVKGPGDATRIASKDQIQKFRRMKLAHSETLIKAIFKLNGLGKKDEQVKNG